MSITLYATLEHEIAGVEPNAMDRVWLNEASDSLTEIAIRKGVDSLETFYSYESGDMEDLLDDSDVSELMPPVEWFDARNGLATVKALLKDIAAGTKIKGRGKDATEDVVRELEDLKHILTAAAEAGVRFRLHPGE